MVNLSSISGQETMASAMPSDGLAGAAARDLPRNCLVLGSKSDRASIGIVTEQVRASWSWHHPAVAMDPAGAWSLGLRAG